MRSQDRIHRRAGQEGEVCGLASETGLRRDTIVDCLPGPRPGVIGKVRRCLTTTG